MACLDIFYNFLQIKAFPFAYQSPVSIFRFLCGIAVRCCTHLFRKCRTTNRLALHPLRYKLPIKPFQIHQQIEPIILDGSNKRLPESRVHSFCNINRVKFEADGEGKLESAPFVVAPVEALQDMCLDFEAFFFSFSKVLSSQVLLSKELLAARTPRSRMVFLFGFFIGAWFPTKLKARNSRA